ncbi:MAG: PstS family phosphate ABC transporter substrate-binding protein, partial [Aggregatilineales bacterium]
DAFQPLYTKITVTQTPFGNDTGFSNLCAGSVDLIGATRLPTDAETAACKANTINPIQLTLGGQGVVLLINAGNTFATCLTTDQLAKLFGIASDSKVKKWSDVDSKFPATDLLLLSPNDGDLMTDLLITKTVKGVAPLARTDMTPNSDPLYRAAGTANVAGAITYMSYTDYKKVTAKVTVVQVDGGKGCVTPSDKTLADGTYPLSQQIYLFLNPAAFARPEVKAFVWYLLSDDALAVLSSKSDLVGLDRGGFVSARDVALTLFAQAPAGTPGPGTPTAPAVATTLATGAPTAAATAAPTITVTAVPTTVSTAASTAAG